MKKLLKFENQMKYVKIQCVFYHFLRIL